MNISRLALSAVTLALLSGCTSTTGSDSSDPGTDTPGTDAPPYAALPSAKAKQVTAGRLHACALMEDGTVRCWGYDPHVGTIGNGGELDDKAFPIPVAVKNLTDVKQISASSSDYTCAVTNAGAVKCWGDDAEGTLTAGVPYTDNRPQASSTPLDVPGLASGVEAVAVGDTSACALMTDKTVKCWGTNGPQIGDGNEHVPGDSLPVHVPPQDTGLKDIAQISVGHEHACALTSAGAVKCWGNNTTGEVGDGTDNWNVRSPVDVVGVSNVVKVVAGDKTSCAVLKDGTVQCWGTREYGSIGDGKKDTFDDARTPVAVANLGGNATDISTNAGFACAIVNGGVKCWGSTPHATTEDTAETYQPAGFVPGLESGVLQIVNGSSYACVLVTGGAVKCWGDGHGGVLGNGEAKNETASDTPVAVVSIP